MGKEVDLATAIIPTDGRVLHTMSAFSFMKPFRWSDALSIFNPFEKETARDMEVVRGYAEEVRAWMDLVGKQNQLMQDYSANVRCVCSEANPILFSNDLSKEVKQALLEGKHHRPTFIASPLIITYEGKSVIIELMKSGHIDLYCSTTHIPFQCWIGGKDNNKSLLLTQAHVIGDHCCPRNKSFAGNDMAMIEKYETFFHDLLKSAKRITTVADANESFVFMDPYEMEKAALLMHKSHKSCGGHVDTLCSADKSFFLGIAKKSRVSPSAHL